MDSELLQPQQGDEAFAKLMQAPAFDPNRTTIAPKREKKPRKPVIVETFADIWYKSLRGKVDVKRARPLDERVPTYADWLRGTAKLKGADIKREVERARQEWTQRRANPE